MKFLRLVRFASTAAAAASAADAPAASLAVLRNAIALGRSQAAQTALGLVPGSALAGLAAADADALVALVAQRRAGTATSSGKLRQLRAVLARLAAAGARVSPAAAAAAEVAALCDAGQLGAAVVLSAESSSSAESFHALLVALARNGHAALAASRLPKDAPISVVESVAVFAASKDVALAEQLRKDYALTSDKVLGAIAYAYAEKANITMATKTVNECGEKKGVYCFNAIVRAHAELMNPGDADWTYRDLRLAGLSAPADVYTSLIRVHGYSGDLTKASKYLSKRDETPNTNTPVSDRPASQFRASRNMHTALIEAYAVNGEVLGAWRAFAEAWKEYGVSLYNSNDKRYMTAIARHYIALEKTPEEIIASLKEVIETTHLVPPKNALMFREHVGLALGEGLLRLSSSELNPPASTTPQALVLSKFPPVDAKKASTLSKAILESLLSPTSPLATQPPPETASAIRKSAYTNLKNLLESRVNTNLMLLHSQTANVKEATALLEASKARSRGLVTAYLRTIAAAVESSSLTPEAALEASQKGVSALQAMNGETDAKIMELIVRIAKSDLKAKTAIMDLPLGEAVEKWVRVGGGIPNASVQPLLSKVVEEIGVKLLI